MIATALVAFAIGACTSVLAVLAEHSGIAFGPFSLSGNGALIVPLIGASLGIFAMWTARLRRRSPNLHLVAAVVGIHFGIGMAAPIDAALNGTLGADSVAGFLLQGLIFVLPTALLAALAAWAFLSGGLPLHPVVIVIVLVASVPLAGAVAFLATGLATGVAVALAVRARDANGIALTAVGLVAFLLFAGFGMPYLMAPNKV